MPISSVNRGDLVLVGGGHAHVEVIRRLGMSQVKHADGPWRTTLISAGPTTIYSGMLTGHVAGHYSREDISIDLAQLCLRSGVRFVSGVVTGIDPVKRRVRLEGAPPLEFERLSLDTGSTPIVPAGLRAAPLMPLKPADRFLDSLPVLDRDVAAASTTSPLEICLVGGGVAGCEVALALAHRYTSRTELRSRVRVTLLETSSRVVPSGPKSLSTWLASRLAQNGVRVVTDVTDVEWDKRSGGIQCHAGRERVAIAADRVILATPATAPSFLAEAGLAVDARGFQRVDATLRSVSHASVFAAGDVAGVLNRDGPVAKAGVYAVRAGPVLFANLTAGRDTQLTSYRPQRNFLALLSLGSKSAVAVRGGVWIGRIFGDALAAATWQLKDRIDRGFMARYRASVPERSPDVGADSWLDRGDLAQMPCHGCGTKLPARVLAGGLAPSVASGLDDASRVPLSGTELYQSFDFITAFTSDIDLVARVAVVHALNDIHAMGVRPTSALVHAVVARASRSAMQRDFARLMDSVGRVLAREDVTLLGGHSSAAESAGVGLLVQGECTKVSGGIWKKSGARPGLDLVLTKALGSGAVLRGFMQGFTTGAEYFATLGVLAQSHRDAFAIFRKYSVAAATDITGFGLAGHLAEMARASNVRIHINAESLRFLQGAERALRWGVRASLAGDNSAGFASLASHEGIAPERVALVFDPQTSGGLVVAVPPESTAEILSALHAGGYGDAARIGYTTEGGVGEGSVFFHEDKLPKPK